MYIVHSLYLGINRQSTATVLLYLQGSIFLALYLITSNTFYCNKINAIAYSHRDSTVGPFIYFLDKFKNTK